MVFVGQRRPEQRHDAVTEHLVHRPLVAVYRLHHGVQGRVQDGPGLFRVEVADQLRRALEVGKEHRDLFAFPFQGAFGRQDLLGKIGGRVGERCIALGAGWGSCRVGSGELGARPDQDVGLPTARLLLLVNYRPEYQHGWGNKTYYTQLRLDPLPPASAEALLQALLGDDPSLVPLKRLLIERTEGNPFFLEESVRVLVETGVLVGARGAYRSFKPLDSLQVPATVQAVLAARIDRLPPEDKRLLQTAAVIGTEVLFALLQAIAELSEEELRRGLGHLQAAEFLYETSLFPKLEYTFKHALTHEVAYGTLLQERRRALHARIVEASERRYADRLTEQAERLAQHALRGEVWDKAVAYCRQAGTKALARSALREVMACSEQALAALTHLPESRATQEQAIDLRFDLRNALWSLGEIGQMLDYLREAKTLAEALDDQPRLGRVSVICADIAGRWGTMTALSSPASMPSPSLRRSAISPCRSWRITTWVWPTMLWATIVGRWGY